VLRDLGLSRNGKTGTTALPVALTGRMDFVNGFWAGSLVDPHLRRFEGHATGGRVGGHFHDESSQPQFLHLDSVEAFGRYSAARIDPGHGVLRSGMAAIDFSGSLTAASVPATHGGIAPVPSFDANSVLHLRLSAARSAWTICGPSPVRTCPRRALWMRSFNSTDRFMRWVAPDGSRWTRAALQRTRGPHPGARHAGQPDHQPDLGFDEQRGRQDRGHRQLEPLIHRFQLDANGAGIDVARIEALRRMGLAVTGQLGFTVKGEERRKIRALKPTPPCPA